MHANTDDSILMRRHLTPSMKPFYTGHIEPMRLPPREDTKIDLGKHIMIIFGALIFAAVIAALLLS